MIGSTAMRAEESPDELKARASAALAQVDGELKLPGLRQRVEVLRDRWGIPHIYAQNADDTAITAGDWQAVREVCIP